MTDTSDLTKDAKKLLRIMYKEYRKRIKNGVSKDRAMKFESSYALKEVFGLEESILDISTTCDELTKYGFIRSTKENESRIWIRLEPLGIAVMEKTPSRIFHKIWKAIQGVRSLLPF